MNKDQLVSIGRADIDELELNGIVLKESDALLLLQTVVDFRIDGLRVICQADITDITQFDTDIFHTDRLKALGEYEKIPFDAPHDISNWQAFFNAFSHSAPFFTVETERKEAPFFLGKLIDIQSDSVVMHTVDGAGRWHDAPSEIAYADITSVQFNNQYTQVYQDFMEAQR